MNITASRRAVTTMVFAGVTIVLIVVAAIGFGLYATKSASTMTETMTQTSTTTESMTGSSSSAMMAALESGGYVNSQTQEFGYSQNYQCTPSMSTFGFNSTETANALKVPATCEVGAGNSTAVAHAAPVFVVVPAYAGLSIFGVGALGASAQGYPVFANQTIPTQCGAGGTGAACPDHPTYLYSPDFSLVEQHLGIKNGVFGLPEGVLPTPSHNHVVGFNGTAAIPWYMVVVLNFDPNIQPNPITGQCAQVVPSNVANPTANCLTSLTAISNAMGQKDSATANANSTQSDPIYSTFGGVATQVLVPGVTAIAETSPANSNLFLYFNVVNDNPYA